MSTDTSQMETIEELLAEAQGRVAILSQNLPKQVDIGSISVDAKIPTKVMIYRQPMFWRTEELARAACDNYRHGNLAAALTLTRATLEGIAATHFLHNKVKKTLDEKLLRDFDNVIMRLLMGSTTEDALEKAIRVGTFIKDFDKEYEGFSKAYLDLCEYAHPNYSGTHGLFAKIDPEKHVVDFGAKKRSRDFPWWLGLSTLNYGLAVYHVLYNGLGEMVPSFIDLCEQDLTK